MARILPGKSAAMINRENIYTKHTISISYFSNATLKKVTENLKYRRSKQNLFYKNNNFDLKKISKEYQHNNQTTKYS